MIAYIITMLMVLFSKSTDRYSNENDGFTGYFGHFYRWGKYHLKKMDILDLTGSNQRWAHKIMSL